MKYKHVLKHFYLFNAQLIAHELIISLSENESIC